MVWKDLHPGPLPPLKGVRGMTLDFFMDISKNPYYLFGLTFNSSPLERKRSVFRDAL